MAESLFGQLGLDMDPEAIIKGRTQEAQALFDKNMSEQAANLPQSQRGIFTAAAGLGRALGGKPVGQLTDKEKQKLAVMDKSNTLLAELKATPKWETMSARDRALASQEVIGKAAMELGDIQMGSQILLDTAGKRQAFKQADKELEKLGVQVEGAELTNEQKRLQTDVMQFGFDQQKIGETGTFSVPSEETNQFDFTSDPTIVTGKVGPDGILRASNGKEYDNYLTNKDFDMFSDNLADAAKTRSSGGQSATTQFLKNFGAAERKGARMAAEDIGIQTEIIQTVGQVITGQGGDTPEERLRNAEAVVGSAGGLVRTIDSVWRTFRGSAKNLNLAINVGGVQQSDGNYSGGENRDLSDYAADVKVPDSIGDNAQEAAKYRSAIMQAVYIDARLAEPGARQLSDADIRNAMDRLGVRTNAPASIFRTLMQNMDRRTSGVRSKIGTVGDIGRAHGIKPGHAQEMIFGKDALGKLDKSREALTALEEQIFGVAPGATEQAIDNPEVPGGTPTQQAPDVKSIIDSL